MFSTFKIYKHLKHSKLNKMAGKEKRSRNEISSKEKVKYHYILMNDILRKLKEKMSFMFLKFLIIS